MKRTQFLFLTPALVCGAAAFGGGQLPGTLNFDNSSSNINPTVAEQADNEKWVETGDFDNDGDMDVAIGVAYSDFGQRNNKLYRNDGGVFNEISGAPLIAGFSITDVTRSVFLRDFNGDGWLDLWVINDGNAPPENGDDNIFMNIHNSNFISYDDQTTSRIPFPLADTGAACGGLAEDFDQDGDIDMYFANYPNDSQDRLYFNTSGQFVNHTSDKMPSDFDYTVDGFAADMNGDGKLDILVSNDFDPNFVYYNDNDASSSGPGDFDYTGSTQELGTASSGENSMTAIDVEGDGDMDIYWTNRNSGSADRILLNGGNDVDSKAMFTQINTGLPASVTTRTSRKATPADFNNDGRTDLFVGKEAGANGRPTVLRNASAGGEVLFLDWTPADAFPSGSTHDGWHGAAFEVNGDDRPDIFLGAQAGDHLFTSAPANEVDENDGTTLPALFNLDPVAVVGHGTTDEVDVYDVDTSAASNGFLSVVVNGADDYLLEVLNNGVPVANSNRGGLGVEEALTASGISNGMRQIRVTILDSNGGPGSDPADINGDGDVGPGDLASLLDAWGACPGCPQDINGDGEVGPGDLAQLLDSWGPVKGGGTNDYILEVLGRNG